MSENLAWWDRLGPGFHAAIQIAERRGEMTYPALNAVIGGENRTSQQIEMLLEYLRQRGIELVDDDP